MRSLLSVSLFSVLAAAASAQWDLVTPGEATGLSANGAHLTVFSAGVGSGLFDTATNSYSGWTSPKVAVGVSNLVDILLQDPDSFETSVFGHDGTERAILTSGGSPVFNSRMNPRTGVSFSNDGTTTGYFYTGPLGSNAAVPPPPVSLSSWTAPAGDGTVIANGNDNKVYAYNPSTGWTSVNTFGGMTMTGTAVSDARYITGYKPSGNQFLGVREPDGTYSYVDLGVSSSTWVTQGANDDGKVLAISSLQTKLFNRMGDELSSVSNPSGRQYVNARILMGNGMSYSSFTLTGTFDDSYVASYVTPVPEPATMLALGLGAAAILRRRRSKP